jgi:hypothetical protein
MPKAELIRPLFATANYSYDTRRIAGNGHTLTGDAFAFVDPMFSSDVLMAMSSCAFAAQAIDVWLDNRKAGERLLRDYERNAVTVLRSPSSGAPAGASGATRIAGEAGFIASALAETA